MYENILFTCARRPCLTGHPLRVSRKQNWGRGFMLLLLLAVVLPRSDAGSDVVEPALSFIIKTVRPRAPCGARRGLFNDTAPAIRYRSETVFVHGQMKLPNTTPQAIELNPTYSGQAHSNRPGTGHE